MKILEITSLSNPKVKFAQSLQDKRDRDRSQLFLIEGYREISRAVEGKQLISQLFFCEEFFLGENEQTLIRKIASTGAEIFQCTKSVFAKFSYRDRPDGLLAVAKQARNGLKSLESNLKKPELFLIAEAIEKPGNLGTLLRTSDAVGASGVIVCDQCTDVYNPNVVRASVGTLFTVPVVEATSDETIRWLKEKGIQILAATPHAKEVYVNVDMKKPTAIAVGTEQLGLSKKWMDEADVQVRIPMMGVADSLNVATATTLLLYEALRQRSYS